jgi:hypothetical protein
VKVATQPLTGAWMAARRWRTGDETSAPSSYGASVNKEGMRQGEGVRCSTGVWVPFYRVGRGQGWPEIGGAVVVIGPFMAAIIGSEGGGIKVA